MQGSSNFYKLMGMKSLIVTILMKAIEQYFPVVLFIMMYKVVLKQMGIQSLSVTIQMKATSGAVLSCGAAYYAVQG